MPQTEEIYAEGIWLLDRLHGETGNVLQFAGQEKYEGGFFFGLRHGSFAEYYGSVCFTGVYNYGVRKGRGEVIKGDGKVLLGSYINNKISGPVKFLTDENLILEVSGCGFGSKSTDKQLSVREATIQDIYECLVPSQKHCAPEIFKRLCFNSDSDSSEICYSDGSVYRGQTLMGMRHGVGIQNWKSGAIYQGDWEYDTAMGYGKLESPDHVSYVGNWVHGEAAGKGVFLDGSGSRFKGIWESDAVIDLKSASWPAKRSVPSASQELEEAAQNKIELEQIFTDGVQSVVKVTFPNGDYYEGTLWNN